ncbi:SIMPL domain-containing protein [Aromatoleum sp.]|uniref:SIMPL domain-containing protein n=1 Tax=Aromatoleum sp. TaxID=2307007 RepID=UPI002FC7FC08
MCRAASRYLRFLPTAFVLAFAPLSAVAHPSAEPAIPTVELSAEASRPAPNDMAIANAYFEASGTDPAKLADHVNGTVASALEEIRRSPDIKVKTAGTGTYPVYGKDGRRIETWRMRSELQLESRNLPALAKLLGKLPASLAVSGLVMQPAPETRKNVADQVATDALRAFQVRAKTIADTLGRAYRIRQLSIGYGGGQPIRPMKSMAFRAEAAPMPIEAGETEIVVTVNGTVELTD